MKSLNRQFWVLSASAAMVLAGGCNGEEDVSKLSALVTDDPSLSASAFEKSSCDSYRVSTYTVGERGSTEASCEAADTKLFCWDAGSGRNHGFAETASGCTAWEGTANYGMPGCSCLCQVGAPKEIPAECAPEPSATPSPSCAPAPAPEPPKPIKNYYVSGVESASCNAGDIKLGCWDSGTGVNHGFAESALGCTAWEGSANYGTPGCSCACQETASLPAVTYVEVARGGGLASCGAGDTKLYCWDVGTGLNHGFTETELGCRGFEGPNNYGEEGCACLCQGGITEPPVLPAPACAPAPAPTPVEIPCEGPGCQGGVIQI